MTHTILRHRSPLSAIFLPHYPSLLPLPINDFPLSPLSPSLLSLTSSLPFNHYNHHSAILLSIRRLESSLRSYYHHITTTKQLKNAKRNSTLAVGAQQLNPVSSSLQQLKAFQQFNSARAEGAIYGLTAQLSCGITSHL